MGYKYSLYLVNKYPELPSRVRDQGFRFGVCSFGVLGLQVFSASRGLGREGVLGLGVVRQSNPKNPKTV